uniref:Moesin/ezrin/radixin homolog 1 n=1 Tax=Culicoides sonorensis TaxID=179676 RepID=A0A336MDB5_CULSO
MFKGRSEGNVVYKCTVRLLEDDEILECEFQPHHKGNFLLEYVCEQLQITEKDYFGLRFIDNFKNRNWLDLSKTIIKQVKDVDPLVLSFRIKFYPADPCRMSLNGKYNVFQQLKRDLRHGRLYCSLNEGAVLASLIIQDELGDYIREIHTENYAQSLRLALRQTDQLERKAMELHKKREPGQEPNVVYDEFIALARTLETYGVDPHPVKDHRGTQIYLGINFTGISTFQTGKRLQHYRWHDVHKLNFEGKMFIVHLTFTDDRREVKKHTVGFKCTSGVTCRYVWRCAIEQMLFFTLPSSSHASVMSGGGFFSFGTKFRYTGRTEREIMSERLAALRGDGSDTSPSKRKASSVPATPSSPQGELIDIRYNTLPRSTMSEPMGNTDQASSVYCPDPILETVSEERRNNGGAGSTDHLSDYYFRDSFEHSSTESGFTSVIDTRAGPYRQFATSGDSVPLAFQNSVNNAALIIQQNATNDARIKKFSILHAFIPSFLIVLILLTVSTIFILETESDTFRQIKDWPEMLSLNYQYYQPFKAYMAKTFGGIF